MRPYWLRISFGALVIFGVGMVGLHLVRQGSSKVHSLIHSADPISLPLAFVPFRLAGEKLGDIRHLQLDRSAPDRVDSIQLTVELNDAALASRLADCRLSATDAQSFGPQTSFLCVSPADSARMHLVPFGTVRFEPAGDTRPLLLPADMVAQWHGRDRSNVRVDVQAGRTTVSQAQALRQGGRPAQLDIQGDSVHVAIESRSDGGRFTLRADSNGAFLSIRDAKGHDVVLLRADSNGALFKVKGDSVNPGH